MSKECITDQKQVLILARKSAFVDHKEAFTFVGLVQILLGVDLEDVVAHLETNRLDFVNDLLARFLNVAESLISLAIELW